MTIATDDALVSRPVDPVARRQTLITGWLLIGLAVFVALVFGTQVDGNATFRLSLPRDVIQVPNLVVPAAPFIIGFILGPMAETNLRRGLMLSDGNFADFFTTPIAGSFLGLALAFILWQVFSALRPKPSAINAILRT